MSKVPEKHDFVKSSSSPESSSVAAAPTAEKRGTSKKSARTMGRSTDQPSLQPTHHDQVAALYNMHTRQSAPGASAKRCGDVDVSPTTAWVSASRYVPDRIINQLEAQLVTNSKACPARFETGEPGAALPPSARVRTLMHQDDADNVFKPACSGHSCDESALEAKHDHIPSTDGACAYDPVEEVWTDLPATAIVAAGAHAGACAGRRALCSAYDAARGVWNDLPRRRRGQGSLKDGAIDEAALSVMIEKALSIGDDGLLRRLVAEQQRLLARQCKAL